MIESESQVVKQAISGLRQEKGILYVPPLVDKMSEVSVAVAPTKQSLPYTVVSSVQLTETKRKSERLVEVETLK